MQPLLTQVPPNRLRSIIATFIPVAASRTARDDPACPVPITIASYLVAIGIPPLLLSKSYLRLAKGDLSASLTLGEAVYGASTALCCPGKTRTWRRLVRNASAHCDMTKNRFANPIRK